MKSQTHLPPQRVSHVHVAPATNYVFASCQAFATSVAFTATVSQIAADPHLFKLWPPLTREIRDRDLRVLSLMALCFGAGVGQSLLDTDLRFSGSLAICAACKTVLAVIWWLPQGQPVQPRRPSRRER